MKIARWSIGLLLILPLGLSAGQQGDQPSTQQPTNNSLVDAARRAREQKRDQPKAVHVWNDDNVPKTNGVSVVGQTPGPEATSASADGSNPGAAPAPIQENLTGIAAQLNSAKEHLKSLQTDLDILQRKSALDEQVYLSKPEYENDKEAAAGLKSEKDKVAALQAEVVEEQKKVDELQAKLSASAPN
ncbi:MAG: hypothetical protein WCD49_08730 [Candidatus Acidiferrales bacterium]